MKFVSLLILGLGWVRFASGDDFQGSTHMMPFEEDTIAYSKTPDSGPVARLQRKIDQGKVQLKYQEAYGYLLSVLEELKVPKSSQMLVSRRHPFSANVEEAPLSARVNGTSGFAQEFAAAGPKDLKGRSLREFDLRQRLFKYPCSYLIYSEAFDELPEPLKESIYKRLFNILTGKDKESESIQPQTHRAILEILRETKAGLPAHWN